MPAQVHKILAGMLDVHEYNGDQQALSIVQTLVDKWLVPYVMLSTFDLPNMPWLSRLLCCILHVHLHGANIA